MTIQFDGEVIADLHKTVARKESEIPVGFEDYNLYAERQLSDGKWPGTWAARSKDQEKGAALAQAILSELRLLICKNDPKYRSVSKAGRDFLKQAIPAIAGYIAAAFGIGLALATSAVAACALVLVRVGVEVFCQATKNG